jgi:hypothetical protein
VRQEQDSSETREKAMHDTFISYVEEDAAIAQQIAWGLESAGYRTWYYTRDSVPGPSYLIQTGQAIAQSQAIVLLISPHSIGSSQVSREVVRAHESGKHFIPVLHNMTHDTFQRDQPEWREAVGAAVSIFLPSEGVPVILPRIIEGLKALGIQPGGIVQPREAQGVQGQSPIPMSPQQLDAPEFPSKISRKPPMAQKRIALLIGNSRCQDTNFEQLKCPIADVRILEELLKNKDIGQFTDVFLLENQNRQQIFIKLDEILKPATDDDLVFIYFSGHGTVERNTLYLVPLDANTQNLKRTAISLEEIKETVAHSSCQQVVLFLDWCFNSFPWPAEHMQSLLDKLSEGTIIRILTPPIINTPVGKEEQKHERLTELLQILTTDFNEDDFRNLCFDLEVDYDVLPGQGKAPKARELVAYFHRRRRMPQLIAAISQRSDISWTDISREDTPEAAERLLSRFTQSFIEGLENGEIDANTAGAITFYELFRYLCGKAPERSEELTDHPWKQIVIAQNINSPFAQSISHFLNFKLPVE